MSQDGTLDSLLHEDRVFRPLPQMVIEANISQGTITESVSYQETGITLEVTPRINDQGDITMKVRPTQRIAGARVVLQNSSAFPIDTRTVETELRVPDSATFVIGGLRSNDVNKTHQKVPLLGDIPILGVCDADHCERFCPEYYRTEKIRYF